ncbi:MAG: IS66 family transposase, partial [Polynucleobacter sp.]|nr:IS66 family transposase [Polynucleobacter sp.]
MTALADTLPDDPEALKAIVLAERAAHAASLAERDAEAERLRQIIKEMQRHRFGRRAETLPIDQLELALEDVQQVEADEAAHAEAGDPARKAATASKRRANRGSLPEHLPRVETLVDVEDKTCPCCSGGLHLIGEDR